MEIVDFFYLVFGYLLGGVFGLSIPWFCIVLVTLHYISRLVTPQEGIPYLTRTRGPRTPRKKSFKKIPSSPSMQYLDEITLDDDKRDHGVSIVNQIIEKVYFRADIKMILDQVNEMLEEMKPNLMDKMEVTKFFVGKIPPKISNLKCVEHSQDNTVIEFDLDYNGEAFIEWVIRPHVVPLDLKCMAKEFMFHATFRFNIEYSGLGVKELTFCFSEYPEVDFNINLFDSVDFNAIASHIPILNLSIRKKFKEYLETLVYPNTIPLIQLKGIIPMPTKLLSDLDQESIGELEDEIKNSILNVEDLLSKKVQRGINKETAKKEVFESILQFLKFGAQPNKIPVSMIEVVQRGFSILNSLLFDENGKIVTVLFNNLMQKENVEFLGHVVRNCSYGDPIIKSLLSITDDKLRAKVNEVFNENDLQDLPLTVINRSKLLQY